MLTDIGAATPMTTNPYPITEMATHPCTITIMFAYYFIILEYLDPGKAGRGSGAQFLFKRAAQRDGGDGVGHGGSP